MTEKIGEVLEGGNAVLLYRRQRIQVGVVEVADTRMQITQTISGMTLQLPRQLLRTSVHLEAHLTMNLELGVVVSVVMVLISVSCQKCRRSLMKIFTERIESIPQTHRKNS